MNTEPLSREEQEALVDVIIHKIPTIKETDRLELLVQQALELLLHNPEDMELRQTLHKCASDLFAALEFVPPSEVRKAQERRTARDCVEVLQAAREHRLPRDLQVPVGQPVHRDVSTANDNHHAVPKHRHHRHAKRHHNREIMVGVVVMVLVMGAVGGALVWRSLFESHNSIFSDAKTFVAQMIAVGAGGEEQTDVSGGGSIRHKVKDAHVLVVAEKVPSRLCAAAGWELVHKGTLTIDGVTPRRVSSAILTELCYEGENQKVTLVWEPKPVNRFAAPGAQP